MDYIQYKNWLVHSKGPWKEHKYIKKIGNKYFYSAKSSVSKKEGYEDVPDKYDWENDPRLSDEDKQALYAHMSSYGDSVYDTKMELKAAEQDYDLMLRMSSGATAGTARDPGAEKVAEAKKRLIAARESYNKEAKAVVDNYYSKKATSADTVKPNFNYGFRPRSRKRVGATTSGGVRKRSQALKLSGKVGIR